MKSSPIQAIVEDRHRIGGGALTGTLDVTSAVLLTSESDALRHISGVCFKTGPPRQLGAEVEWLVVHHRDPSGHVSLADVSRHLSELDLAGGSTLTFEPGGQLELSSTVHTDPAALVRALDSDVSQVLLRLAELGLTLSDRAFDDHRPPHRQLHSPRYEAMEEYFTADDPELGPSMMCRCAGLQVNLDCGSNPADITRRWRLLYDMGPALSAAFSNSPAAGWRSRRQAVWQQLDPARTRTPVGDDPAEAWARYALDAPVMMIRTDGRWQSRPGVTFREWVNGAEWLRRPTLADLDYHLTTLFPPVRPRGWFEVRYIDAQPRDWWTVPVLLLWALTNDLEAAEACLAGRADEETWQAAARDGLGDSRLRATATDLFATAIPILERLGSEPAMTEQVARFAERFTSRGLSPADHTGSGRRDDER